MVVPIEPRGHGERSAPALKQRDASGLEIHSDTTGAGAAKFSTGWRIAAMGDRCLIIEFGNRVDREINARARAAADFLLANPIPGVVDVVPAFTTVAVHYHPEALADAGGELPHARLRRRIDELLGSGVPIAAETARVIDVPVCYGGDFGPDLGEIARALDLTEQQVIDLHGASPHVVYMLGFAPGFPYLGGLDARLAVPRRATPRTRIPAGSVAIAREQTAIYSLETPGGWNLIGRTPLRLFTPEANPPCLLRVGDRVRFVPISQERFAALEAGGT
jgi:inhibitor of KinA